MKKLVDTSVILIILAIATALGSSVGGSLHGKGAFVTLFSNTLIAMLVLSVMCLMAYAVSFIPSLNTFYLG